MRDASADVGCALAPRRTAAMMYGLCSSLKNEIVKIAPKGRVNVVAPGTLPVVRRVWVCVHDVNCTHMARLGEDAYGRGSSEEPRYRLPGSRDVRVLLHPVCALTRRCADFDVFM